jgi:predicted transcriptional regulator
MDEQNRDDLIMMAADIVSAFISNNAVRAAELPDLIQAVHAALQSIAEGKPDDAPPPALVPAVSIKKSVTDDYLVCLDDGKKFKSLKRHLSALGMTPDDYRAKWKLPRDYPMVAPGYASRRSELAKASGLGSNRRKAQPVPVLKPAEPAPANDGASGPAKRRRGRPAQKAA